MLLLVRALAVLLAVLASPASGVTLLPGDLLALSVGPGPQKIYRIDPVTGVGAAIPTLEPIENASGLALLPSGEIVFTEVYLNGPRRITALDPATGAFRTLSQHVPDDPDHMLTVPRQVTVSPDGRIFVIGSYEPVPGNSNVGSGLFEIDPDSGVQRPVHLSPWLVDLDARWLGGDSPIFEAGGFVSFLGSWREQIPATSTGAGFAGAIVRVDVETGEAGPAVYLPSISFPDTILRESDDTYFVLRSGSFRGPGAILRVRESDGGVETIADGGAFPWGAGMVRLPDGDFAVSYSDGIERVDFETGARSYLFRKPFFAEDFTSLVLVPVPEPGTSVLVAAGLLALSHARRKRSPA